MATPSLPSPSLIPTPPPTPHFTVERDAKNNEVFIRDKDGKELVAAGYSSFEQYSALVLLMNEIFTRQSSSNKKSSFDFNATFNMVKIEFHESPNAPATTIAKIKRLLNEKIIHIDADIRLEKGLGSAYSSFKTIHAAAMTTFKSGAASAKTRSASPHRPAKAPVDHSGGTRRKKGKGPRSAPRTRAAPNAATFAQPTIASPPVAATPAAATLPISATPLKPFEALSASLGDSSGAAAASSRPVFRSLHDIGRDRDLPKGRLPDRFVPALMSRALLPSHKFKIHKDATGRVEERLDRLPAIRDNLELARGHVERIQKELGELGEAASPTKVKLERELLHYQNVIKNSQAYMKEYGAEVSFIDSEGKPLRDETGKDYVDENGVPVKEFVQRDWAGPNFSRDLLLDHGFDGGVARMVPALVNLRVHSTQPALVNGAPVEVRKLTRVAVLTDDTNGWFSLKDLNELRVLKADENQADFDRAICTKANKIIDKVRTTSWQKFRKTGLVSGLSKKITEPGQIAKEISKLDEQIVKYEAQLVDTKLKLTGKKDFEIRTMINRLQSARHALTQLQKCITLGGLEEVHGDRERVLKDKALQLLVVQIQQHPKKLINGQFKMGFVGLVNQASAGLDKSGVLRNERVFMEDNSEIFKHLNGMRIIFSDTVESPYIDETPGAGAKGTIYLPLKLKPSSSESDSKRTAADPRLDTFMLTAVFINVCAQPSFTGHARNNNAQLKINQDAAKALKSASLPVEPDDKQALLVNALTRYNTPRWTGMAQSGEYARAAELTTAFMDAGFATITGCASAKDRTGVNVSNVLHRTRPKARNAMFDTGSLNVDVLLEGTGVSNPKINTFNIFSIFSNFKNFLWGFILFFKTRSNVHEEAWKLKAYEILRPAVPAVDAGAASASPMSAHSARALSGSSQTGQKLIDEDDDRVGSGPGSDSDSDSDSDPVLDEKRGFGLGMRPADLS